MREEQMGGFQNRGFLQCIILLCCLSPHFFAGLANDPSNSEAANNTASHRSRSMVINVIIICLGVVAVMAFTFFLFKLWQKKKREESHARLLKLFEDDDELEVELGIKD